MYVSFPKNYFVEVMNKEDFEYNYIGKTIDYEELRKNNGIKASKIVYEVSDNPREILDMIDNEYVLSEISK